MPIDPFTLTLLAILGLAIGFVVGLIGMSGFFIGHVMGIIAGMLALTRK